MRTQILVFLLAFLAAGLSGAHADVCSALRAQISSSGQTSQSAALSRQLASIGALQRQRRCGNENGLFSACRDLALRHASVLREIQSVSKSGRNGAILARLDDLGCSSNRSAPQRQAPAGSFSSSARLFCVRMGDGYFFPAPHSQFTANQDLKTTLDMCRYICDEPAMDVYALGDLGRETEEMQSVQTRKRYLDLPAAYAYRENAAFKSCDLQRYYRRVNEARARTVTPTDLSNANISVPTPKPDLAPSDETTAGLTAFIEESADKPMPDRKVRQVGTAFFPPQ